MTPYTRVIQMDEWLNSYAKEWKQDIIANYLSLVRDQSIFKNVLEESFGK